MLRRNGKQPSCEPCRKSKIKCDHRQPTCSKCDERGLTAQCHYHPAPLTRPRSETGNLKRHRIHRPAVSSRSSLSPIPPGNTLYERQNQTTPAFSDLWGDGGSTHSRSHSFSQAPLPAYGSQFTPPASVAQSEAVFSPGIGFASIFRNMATPGEPVPERPNSIPSTLPVQTPANLAEMAEFGATILSRLDLFDSIKELAERYLKHSQICPMPRRSAVEGLTTLGAILAESRATDRSYAELARKITHNTCHTLSIPANTKARDFHRLVTGENIRWEFLGLVFTWVALSVFWSSPQDSQVPGPMLPIYASTWTQFADIMAECSSSCISFCHKTTPANDFFIWLLYENLTLSTLRHGDSSHYSWQRLGDLSTEIFALGLHRQSPTTQEDLPFFVIQSRRKMFAAAYQIDKSIASFFGRPPRISSRFCEFNLPLDLDDTDVFSEDFSLEQALANLDYDGWNKDRRVHSTTWVRLRYWLSKFREECLELSLGPESEDIADKLQQLIQRSTKEWEHVPPWLRYEATCWNTDIPSTTCLMLLVVYLDHLHSQFQMQRLLFQHSPQTIDSLLESSMNILNTALILSSGELKAPGIQRERGWIIPFYALPPAATLAFELRKRMQQGISFPETVPKTQVIRQLSVLIAALGWIVRPSDGNYNMCTEAAKVLGNTLDEALGVSPLFPTPSLGSTAASIFDGMRTPLLPPLDTTLDLSASTDAFFSWCGNMESEGVEDPLSF